MVSKSLLNILSRDVSEVLFKASSGRSFKMRCEKCLLGEFPGGPVPLVGRQGSRVSMRVARGCASLLSSHGRGIWPRDVLNKVSRGLSRVEAGNPGFPRLVQVTSGGFSWWL